MILIIPRPQAGRLPASGCWPIASLAFLLPPLWRARAEVEHDEALLQPIAYLLLRNAAGQVWCYQRAGGDARVDGCYSCGVGGHADATDALSDSEPFNTEFNAEATLRQALLRELSEELHASPQELDDLRLRGLIYDGLSPVDRVHLGVLYTARWCPAKPPQPPAGEALQGLGFMDLKTIIDEPRFELWSRLAVQHLITFP